MKKLILIVLFTTLFFVNGMYVKANSLDNGVYYTNINGIKFSKSEYDFFTKMYYEGYQELVNLDEFEYYEEVRMHPE